MTLVGIFCEASERLDWLHYKNAAPTFVYSLESQEFEDYPMTQTIGEILPACFNPDALFPNSQSIRQ